MKFYRTNIEETGQYLSETKKHLPSSKDGVQTSDFADTVATEGGVRAETKDRKSQGSRSGRRRPETGTGNRAEQRTSGAMKKLRFAKSAEIEQ
nr:hypothetical protein Itr_chr02CG09780 [Ipomoea trifida]